VNFTVIHPMSASLSQITGLVVLFHYSKICRAFRVNIVASLLR